ncbi:lactam utilization protein LamB [Brenneria goodwinii]|uniref:5-oxoprolinase subunit A n=1 Tax=Brenneria goodwinii TaxID=1109412 RepID=A0AAE8ESS8_9GAMM|nr:lactam utilization protein LamB [Brenneria goodwinii]RLM28623.1 lactam utilization protein LamB [Brenneria goodwinii]
MQYVGEATVASIDINCDMGESFGAWNMGDDALLMQYISSANIACGFHAGDPDVMLETVRRALACNVAIGAHPGLPDLQGFGRREMALAPSQVYALVAYQVGALYGVARAQGGSLHHVKTHGALYGMTARQPEMARAVAQAVYDIDATLPVYVANANMAQAVRERGLPVVYEVYADRSYQDDGTLTPRNLPNAMIEDVDQAIAQVLQMVHTGTVTALSGKRVPIDADTLCIHGDQAGAANFAAHIRSALLAEGIEVRTP